ncbi:MAG: hypothetical protein P1U83_13175 [Roseovarius sp.]|nr:hypothetical protein [Roseovarius sp.]
MNANQIINMVVRLVMRKAINGGVNAGINAIGNRKSKAKPNDEQTASVDTGETQKRMRQTLRMTKRFGRF